MKTNSLCSILQFGPHEILIYLYMTLSKRKVNFPNRLNQNTPGVKVPVDCRYNLRC